MIDKRKITAIILVAGNSTRFNQNRNKNFELINGKSVLYYSLTAFDCNNYIDDIIIAVKNEEIDKVQNIIKEANISKNTKLILGGNSRNESVYNCIKNTNSEIVIIHDGARPLIKQEYINLCIESMQQFDGVTMGVRSKDTVKIVNNNNIIINTTQRNNTWLVQTPQAFDRRILLKMHHKYQNENVNDDCELLEKGHYKLKILEGSYTNIKITTYEDLIIAEKFLSL